MELRQLRCLVALAEARNFTRAADHELIAQLMKGTRVGLALGASLTRARIQIQSELAIAAGDHIPGDHISGDHIPGGHISGDADAATPPATEQISLGHRWMALRDLEGYIALGDPAARLNVPGRRRSP